MPLNIAIAGTRKAYMEDLVMICCKKSFGRPIELDDIPGVVNGGDDGPGTSPFCSALDPAKPDVFCEEPIAVFSPTARLKLWPCAALFFFPACVLF